MGQTNVTEYVGKSLGGRNLKALGNALGTLVDKGVIEFREGASAGYLDSLELADGKTLEDVDAVLAEWKEHAPEKPKTGKPTAIQKVRGQYESGLIMPTDKVTKTVFNRMAYDTETAIEVVSKECARDNQARNAIVTLRDNKNRISEVLSGLDEHDRLIFVTVCNCVANGVYRVSPLQLFRRAYQSETATPSEAQLERVRISIEKLGSTWIRLDVRALFDIYPDLELMKAVGNLIEVVGWAYRPNRHGEISTFYEFGDTLPILFQYAQTVNQITTVKPQKATALSTKLSRTKDNRAIVQLIADRINGLDGMKKGGKKPYRNMYKINYQSFYDVADFSKCKSADSVRKKRQRIKNAAERQLMYLTDRGVIASWERLEDGTGVTVNPGGAA